MSSSRKSSKRKSNSIYRARGIGEACGNLESVPVPGVESASPNIYLVSKSRGRTQTGLNIPVLASSMVLDALLTGASDSFAFWHQPQGRVAPNIY